jgi:hypothetical protein
VPPSFDHEILVELFRNCGPLAPALLHLCGRAVLAHDRVEVTALAAIAPLPTDRRKLYFDLVMARLPASTRQSIQESLMLQDYKYQSLFALRIYNDGHQEGREEGRSQGREDGLRAALLALAPTRLAAFTDDDAAAIHALRGEQALTALVSALGQATTPAEARTSFDLVIHKLKDA